MTDQIQDITNDDLLDELASRLASGEISKQQVDRCMQNSQIDDSNSATNSGSVLPASSIMKLLYIVGAIFISIGVLYFVSQIWDDLNVGGRIFITLGLGLTFAGTGSYFMFADTHRELGTVFHGIGGLMIPGGALITLDEMNVDFDSRWPVTITIGMVFLFYALLTVVHHRVVLSFFAIANGTAFLYLLLFSLVPTASGEAFNYLTMTIGVSYLLFGHLFRRDWNERLTPLLFFFGAIGFYSAGFSQVPDHLIMELLYPILTFGGLTLSVAVFHSRLILVISTFATIGYIVYFTAEYFADSIGWPIALILLGFVIIAIGNFSIKLNRKYLKVG